MRRMSGPVSGATVGAPAAFYYSLKTDPPRSERRRAHDRTGARVNAMVRAAAIDAQHRSQRGVRWCLVWR